MSEGIVYIEVSAGIVSSVIYRGSDEVPREFAVVYPSAAEEPPIEVAADILSITREVARA